MKKIKWTEFMDMHSGGGCKEEPYEYIYIQAPEEEARVIFYNRFGHDADRVSCTCCGQDYSVTEYDSLDKATEFERKGGIIESEKPMTLAQFSKRKDVLIILASNIKKEERVGEVHTSGWVWQD
jgi:hypothetical protein